jgi:hypothetical protein
MDQYSLHDMHPIKETSTVRISEEVADALKKNYLDDEEMELGSIDEAIAFLIDRDAILSELQNDPTIQGRVEDIERDWRIAELEEELSKLKSEARESQKRIAQAPRAEAVA